MRVGLARREGRVTSLLRAGRIAAWTLVVLLLTSVGVGLVAMAHPPTQVPCPASHLRGSRAWAAGCGAGSASETHLQLLHHLWGVRACVLRANDV